MCEMHIQLCVISVELETNTRMILYDFTQQSSIERKKLSYSICITLPAAVSTKSAEMKISPNSFLCSIVPPSKLVGYAVIMLIYAEIILWPTCIVWHFSTSV